MLAIISPAKSLDFEKTAPIKKHTVPTLLNHSQELIEECRKLSAEAIAKLMNVSPKLAQLNYERFCQWQRPFDLENAKQAIYSFTGDVYVGIDIENLPEEKVLRADNQLRILSGLYGILRPFDLIQAYRLEMGSKLENTRGKNLYQFWGNVITDQLNSDLEEGGHKILVNLASNEYFKAIKKKDVNAEIITPVFKDYKEGKLKMISFYAKKARGMMVRYMLENDLKEKEDLKQFDGGGYFFDESLSSEKEYVFTR